MLICFCRLFVVLGVGCPAATYADWVPRAAAFSLCNGGVCVCVCARARSS